MKTAPVFSEVQMRYLKALLTPECCHAANGHFMGVSSSTTHNVHTGALICNLQKVKAYDKLCRYIGLAPAARPAEGCPTCAEAMKERAKETNRNRMRETRRKKREG